MEYKQDRKQRGKKKKWENILLSICRWSTPSVLSQAVLNSAFASLLSLRPNSSQSWKFKGVSGHSECAACSGYMHRFFNFLLSMVPSTLYFTRDALSQACPLRHWACLLFSSPGSFCPGLLLFSCSDMSTLCNPMNCSASGFLALHHLTEFA